MKISRLVCATLAVLAPLTCGPRTHFDVPQSGQATVTGTPTTLTFSDFEPFSVTKNLTIVSQDIKPSQYQSVQVSTFGLQAINGNLGFIQAITFSMSAPGQPTVVIASAKNLEAATTQAFLQVPTVELVNYFKASSMSITAEVTVTAPSQATVLEAQPVFNFVVNELPAACVQP